MKGILAVLLGILAAANACAEDWPTFQHDNRRSGVTPEQLAMPLKMVWHYRSAVPPQTAWTAPAKWDAYSGNKGLQSMRNFDPAFYVTTAGNKVYFGSSVTNATHCLNVADGTEAWAYVTDSAVRLPPSLHNGRAWFGSDDGYIYCVDAESGELIWKHTPVVKKRFIPSNGKLISPWPVRTGVLIQGGVAYYGASLVPWDSSFLVAVDAAGGSPRFVRQQSGMTLQGALLASADHLYAPQGRSAPLQFSIADGNRIGALGGSGGVYCILTEDDKFIAGPDSQKEAADALTVSDTKGRNVILSFSGGNRILVAGKWAYLHEGRKIVALDRERHFQLQEKKNALNGDLRRLGKQKDGIEKRLNGGIPGSEAERLEAELAALTRKIGDGKGKVAKLTAEQAACYSWALSNQSIPLGFMLAGKTLFIGGDNRVTACDASTGKRVWEAEVSGRAYGLAAANGRLFVSTDRGLVYCFKG